MVEIGKGRLDVHVSAPPRWLAHRDGVFLAACDRALKPPVEALVHLSEPLAASRRPVRRPAQNRRRVNYGAAGFPLHCARRS
jgi:hypothetical protein